MTTSQMPAPRAYSRRLVVSLGIALALHGLMVLIPIYRWLGNNPGESAGVGGGTLPFAGTLLGAAVVIRAPISPDLRDSTTDDGNAVQTETSTEPVVKQVEATPEEPDEATLAVELVPPHRSGVMGIDGDGTVDGSVLSGSLKALGGGGGVEIEMELVPKRWKAHNPLAEIVVERKIKHEEVRLQVLVDTDGHVIDYRVLRSIPRCPECTATVIESAMMAVFDPPVFEGERVRAWVMVIRGFGTEQQ